MSDTAGSNSVSCCNTSDSSSQDDHHHHHHQLEPAARLPEYSQQPIDGIDTRVEMPSTALGSPSPTVPLRPPPKYEHPPPYAVDYTPGRGGVGEEARIHRIPDSTAAAIRREFLRARSPGSNSYTPYIVFACVVFWLCGCVFGAVAFILAVWARRKSTSEAKRLARASLWVSVSGIVVGTVVIILFAFFLSAGGNLVATCGTSWLGSVDYWNDTEQATTSPEVTSSACRVIDNDTTCFRFASSFTADRCSAVDGVIVNVSSSSSSTLAPPLAATAVSVICYHNACVNSYIVGTSCFQHRTPLLDRNGCQGINGYYVLEPSGRSCYYNDCPGFTTSSNKCYRYRKFIPRAGCPGRDAFYEQGYCFYNSIS